MANKATSDTGAPSPDVSPLALPPSAVHEECHEEDAPEKNDRVMVLKEPWLSLILAGKKTMEIRSCQAQCRPVWFHGRATIAVKLTEEQCRGRVSAHFWPCKQARKSDAAAASNKQCRSHLPKRVGIGLQCIPTESWKEALEDNVPPFCHLPRQAMNSTDILPWFVLPRTKQRWVEADVVRAQLVVLQQEGEALLNSVQEHGLLTLPNYFIDATRTADDEVAAWILARPGVVLGEVRG